MNQLANIHKHPDGINPRSEDRKSFVYGHLLEVGDELEATDVYSSASGYWEPCPCPGSKLAGPGIWVRPITDLVAKP